MINGAHSIIYSQNPEADRAFLRDVLGFPNVDVGEGWLIFGLPPAELAVHPANNNDDVHELYLMCDDVEAFVSAMSEQDVDCSPLENLGWGLRTRVSLPGGDKLGVPRPTISLDSDLREYRTGGSRCPEEEIQNRGRRREPVGRPKRPRIQRDAGRSVGRPGGR